MPVKKNSESQSLGSTRDYAERIRVLIETERIVQARALLSEALESHPNDSQLVSLHKVLEPPSGKARPITGNRLVADASSFAELQSRIQNLKKVPLVHRID